MLRFLVLVAILAALMGATPSPSEDEVLTPLASTAATPEEFGAIPVVEDSPGVRRQAGLLLMVVAGDFNSGVIRGASPTAELLFDEPTGLNGHRQLIVRVPDETIDATLLAIAQSPGIVVGPSKSYVHELATNDPYWQGQNDAGLALLDLDTLHSISRGAPSVRVAVIDSGVNEIPDLAGRVDEGRNFVDSENPYSPTDTVGHGTSVASNGTRHPSSNYGNDLDVAAPVVGLEFDEDPRVDVAAGRR